MKVRARTKGISDIPFTVSFMTQTEMAKIQAQQFAFRVQLLEPDFVLQYIGFTNFVSTWLIRRAEPKGSHPTPPAEYVLSVGRGCPIEPLAGCHSHKKFPCHSGCFLNIFWKMWWNFSFSSLGTPFSNTHNTCL